MHLLSRAEEILMMAIINLQDNAYGVTIREFVSRATGFEWSLGAVYAPLHRLEKKMLVTALPGKPIKERGGRSKVYYHVTEEGKSALLKLKNVNEIIWNKGKVLEPKSS